MYNKTDINDPEYARTVYDRQRKGTKYRKDRNGNPIEFRLSFEEWKAIWDESGFFHLRGKGKGKYCMSRKDDLGHYEVGNVFIQLFSSNMADSSAVETEARKAGKKRAGATRAARAPTRAEIEGRQRAAEKKRGSTLSAEARVNISKGLAGRKLSEDHKAKVRAARKFCPHC